MDLAEVLRHLDAHRGLLHLPPHRKHRSLIHPAETAVGDGSLYAASVLWLGVKSRPMLRLVSGTMLSH